MNHYPKSMEYRCHADLNIYDSPDCNRLATQAKLGRQLRIRSRTGHTSVDVCLREDDYPGWLKIEEMCYLEPAKTPYCPIAVSWPEIQAKLPLIIAFTQQAMQVPNFYLWGGTIGPNYDCSGLIQAAFASQGVWLPRDAYQQEAFLPKIAIEALQPGDLVFFGSKEKATHVGLYLGNGSYIHSSGEKNGRNGIGIDVLSEDGNAVSQHYYRELRGFGRVIKTYVSLG